MRGKIFVSKLFLQENETNTSKLALVEFHEEGTSKGAFFPPQQLHRKQFSVEKSHEIVERIQAALTDFIVN